MKGASSSGHLLMRLQPRGSLSLTVGLLCCHGGGWGWGVRREHRQNTKLSTWSGHNTAALGTPEPLSRWHLQPHRSPCSQRPQPCPTPLAVAQSHARCTARAPQARRADPRTRTPRTRTRNALLGCFASHDLTEDLLPSSGRSTFRPLVVPTIAGSGQESNN